MVSQPRINYIHTVFDRTYARFLLSLIERGLALFFSFINNSAFKLSDLVWLFSVLCSVPNFRGCPLSRFPQIDPNCCSTFLNFSYHAKTVLGEGNKKKSTKDRFSGASEITFHSGAKLELERMADKILLFPVALWSNEGSGEL